MLARTEAALIVLMLGGLALIAQQASFALYQAGLLVVIGATVLNVAVSNVPRSSSGWRLLRNVAIGLVITAAVFGVGIALVPFLAILGQS